MNAPARLACLAAIALLSACSGSPPTRYITLDDGRPPLAKSSISPGVAVVRANVPDLIDRPQVVLRAEGNQVTLSEQYRWAEPLRREIPRLIAKDLGQLLNSSRVAALPAEEAGFTVDFKLSLDFQQLDAIVGQGVDVDVLWRLEDRSGQSRVGRSNFRQPLAGALTDTPALVSAQREALRRVAGEIAKEINAYPKR